MYFNEQWHLNRSLSESYKHASSVVKMTVKTALLLVNKNGESNGTDAIPASRSSHLCSFRRSRRPPGRRPCASRRAGTRPEPPRGRQTAAEVAPRPSPHARLARTLPARQRCPPPPKPPRKPPPAPQNPTGLAPQRPADRREEVAPAGEL